MSEDERDQHGIDDLFGDLDEFFAPLEGEAEGEESGERAEGEAPRVDPAIEQVEGFAPRIDIPDEDELLGGGPEDEPEGREGDRDPPAPPGEDDQADDVALEEAPPAAPDEELDLTGEEPDPATSIDQGSVAVEGGLESTAEMTGEEWERLREALRDEESAEPSVAPVAGGETPEPELTVDDLRAAPPEYSGLPADGETEDDEPPVAAEAGALEDQELEDLQDLEELEHLGAPAEEGELYIEDELGGGAAEEATVAAEALPPEQTVEEAAEHFASALRESPDDVERDLLSDLEGAPPEEAEPLGGTPSWQEPAAYAVHEEEEASAAKAAAPGRNMPAAVASAVILGGLVLVLLAVDKTPFVVLAVAVVLLGQGELYGVLKARGFQPATALGLVAGAFVMIGAYSKGDTFQGEAAMIFGVVLAMLLSPFWFAAAPAKARRGLVPNIAVTILGVVYVPFLVSFALLLLAIPGDLGVNLLLTVLGLTVLYDVTAYAIGSVWGNRPLAPSISPNKSWEGAIGATLIVLFVGIAIVPSILGDSFLATVGREFSPALAMGLALVIAIAAPLGDLAESALKRDLGVKDMSSLLPGHGGVLDRIDAILFTAPASYYFVRLFF